MRSYKNIHPKMDRENRAKQFMPFDALKGFREALEEKEKVIVPKRELSEEQKEELDYKLRQIHKLDMVTAEYFHEGEYVQVTGVVSRIDETCKVLKIVNTKIEFGDIVDLRIEEKRE